MTKYTGDISKLKALPDRPITAAEGTKFVVLKRNGLSKVFIGDIVTLQSNDGTYNPFFTHDSYPGSRIAIDLACLALLPEGAEDVEEPKKNTIQWNGRTVEVPARFRVIKDPRTDHIDDVEIGDYVTIKKRDKTEDKLKCSQGWYWYDDYLELVEETNPQSTKKATWLDLDIKYPAKFRFVKNPKDIGIGRFLLGDVITVNEPPKDGYFHDVIAPCPYIIKVDYLEPVSETKEAELSDDVPVDDEPHLECVNGIARVGDYVTWSACTFSMKIYHLCSITQVVTLYNGVQLDSSLTRFYKTTKLETLSEFERRNASDMLLEARGTKIGKIKKGSNQTLQGCNPSVVVMDDGVTAEYQNKPKTKEQLIKESHELSRELFSREYLVETPPKIQDFNPYPWGYTIIEDYGIKGNSKHSIDYLDKWSKQKTKYKQIIKKPLTKKIMSIISKLTRTEDQKALLHFGLIEEDGTLTGNGQQEWDAYVWATGTVDKADFTSKIIEAYKEETKKKCK